jgi:acetolactate decarboxylase
LQALILGAYDGPLTIQELRQHGDMGIGTFNRLDGEMVGFDGRFYQVKNSGQVLQVTQDMKTPYATVTFFCPEKRKKVAYLDNYMVLQNVIDTMISSTNYFYAIRIHGLFNEIRTRSVPAQTKPYPPLTEVVKGQRVFTYRNIEGNLIGFRSPLFVQNIRVPGYHLHFLSQDCSKGGHVLACQIQKAVIELQRLNSFDLLLPCSRHFHDLPLKGVSQRDVESVEKE